MVAVVADNSSPFIQDALLLMQGASYDEAVDMLREAVSLAPGNVTTLQHLADALGASGDAAGQVSAMQGVIALAPGRAENLLALGSTLGRNGRLQEAESALSKAVLLQPANHEASSNLAIAWAQLGRTDEAESAFRVAEAADAPGAASNLGFLLRQVGRPGDAIEFLRKAAEASPRSLPAALQLQAALSESGQLNETIQLGHHISEVLAPGDATARSQLGQDLRALHLGEQGSLADEFLVAVASRDYAAVYNLLTKVPELATFQDEWGMSGVAVATLIGDVDLLHYLFSIGANKPEHPIALLMDDTDQVSQVTSLVTLRIRWLIQRMRLRPFWMIGTPALRGVDPESADFASTNSSVPGKPDAVVAFLLAQGLFEGTALDLERSAAFLLEGVVLALLNASWVSDPSKQHTAASAALRAALRGVFGWRQAYLPFALLKDPLLADALQHELGLELPRQDELRVATGFHATSVLHVLEPVVKRIVQALLDVGAHVDFVPSSDNTRISALHFCAQHDMADVAVLLLDAGASADAEDALGRTAPMIAAAIGSKRMLTIFAERGLLQDQLDRRMDGKPNFNETCSTEEAEVSKERLCDFPVKSFADMTPDRFVSEHVRLRKPVLFKGGASSTWPTAFKNWSLEYLVTEAGDAELSASSIPYAESFGRKEDVRKVTLAGYIRNELALRLKSPQSHLPYYVFKPHKTVSSSGPEGWAKLWRLLQHDFDGFPSFLFEGDGQPHNISFAGMNTQFGLGPPGSGSSPHYHTHAYTFVIFGRKRWFLYPPPHQGMSQTHPSHLEKHPEPGPPPLQCEMAAGDVMYVPEDYGHAVLNLEDTASLAREFADATSEPNGPFGTLLNMAARR